MCVAERNWNKCNNNDQNNYDIRQKRKIFDKNCQTAKQLLYCSQEELLNVQNSDPREFWRKIGKVSSGNN